MILRLEVPQRDLASGVFGQQDEGGTRRIEKGANAPSVSFQVAQVPGDADHIRQFLRAVRNQPAIAADQLRSFTGSALEITASRLADGSIRWRMSPRMNAIWPPQELWVPSKESGPTRGGRVWNTSFTTAFPRSSTVRTPRSWA